LDKNKERGATVSDFILSTIDDGDPFKPTYTRLDSTDTRSVPATKMAERF
jgi:hypothetical protein